MASKVGPLWQLELLFSKTKESNKGGVLEAIAIRWEAITTRCGGERKRITKQFQVLHMCCSRALCPEAGR